MKKFFDFKNKSVLSVALSGTAIVLSAAALIIYGETGVTNYTVNKLDAGVITFCALGIIISAISIIFDFKLIKHAAFLMILTAFFDYIIFEIDYIASIFVGIDNTPVTVPFVLTLLFLFASTVISLVCAIVTKDPIDKKEARVQ